MKFIFGWGFTLDSIGGGNLDAPTNRFVGRRMDTFSFFASLDACNVSFSVFTRESSYCFQRVVTIAILSVCLSVTRVDQSKAVQARITKSSPSAAWNTLVSGTVKLFHKFEGGSPRTRALNEREWAKFATFGQEVAVSQ